MIGHLKLFTVYDFRDQALKVNITGLIKSICYYKIASRRGHCVKQTHLVIPIYFRKSYIVVRVSQMIVNRIKVKMMVFVLIFALEIIICQSMIPRIRSPVVLGLHSHNGPVASKQKNAERRDARMHNHNVFSLSLQNVVGERR